jgi:hypothetical protein
MTVRDPGRRRLLALALTAAGAAIATPIVWALSRLGDPAPTTTLAATPTTLPPSTTIPATTTQPTTTTAAPPTTEPPPTTTTTEPPATKVITSGFGEIPLAVEAICVSAWGGQPPQGDFEEHVIERLTIHHTAARLDTNTRAPHHVRGHQRFHQRDRGWPDLAYHFIVDLNGHVYEGRPLWARGDTGTTYDPTGHFLVCCEGNFDEQEPSAAQLASLVAMLAWAAAEFEVDPATIRGHRDWAATSCPGANLYPFLTDGTLLESVQEVLAFGAPVLTGICGDRAEALVADIEAGVL